MVQMAAEQEKYQHVISRIAGQVWDSAADVTEISIGMPVAVFPKNTVMQNALRQYILWVWVSSQKSTYFWTQLLR